MLKASARSWRVTDSARCVSLTTERSQFHQPRPTKVFRPRLPGATCTVPSEGLVVVGTEKYGPLTLPPAAIALEFAITASEKNCGPPVPAEVGVWARKGRAPTPSKESYPYCK